MIIDQLPLLAGNALTTDEIPIERGVTTYKATLLQALGSVFDTIEPNFADAYDKTATYSVGDYVIHDNSLYKCNTAISTAEEWEATHWTQVNVAEELLAILSDISAKQDKITATGILKGNGSGGVSAAAAGTDYQTPLTAGTDYQTPVHTASITIAYANWSGNGPYTQTVTISGATITANTKVDLQPDATALAQLIADGVTALYISNTSGTLTAYAIGAATTADMTVQCSYYETI